VEDSVIRAGAELFGDLPPPVEIRNEARVHLWHAGHFGSPGPTAFGHAAEAIDCFAAPCCSYEVTVHGRAARPAEPGAAARLRGQGGTLVAALAGADGAAVGRRRATVTDRRQALSGVGRTISVPSGR
jgi:hypothetical protein